MKFFYRTSVLVSIVLLSGCVGISQQHKDETNALKVYQKADVKVERKTVKLNLASVTSVLAIKNVTTSVKELAEAKKEKDVAKEHLDKVLGNTPIVN